MYDSSSGCRNDDGPDPFEFPRSVHPNGVVEGLDDLDGIGVAPFFPSPVLMKINRMRTEWG